MTDRIGDRRQETREERTGGVYRVSIHIYCIHVIAEARGFNLYVYCVIVSPVVVIGEAFVYRL